MLSAARSHMSVAPQLQRAGTLCFLSTVPHETHELRIPTRTIPDEVLRFEMRAYFMSGRSLPKVPVQHMLGEYKVRWH